MLQLTEVTPSSSYKEIVFRHAPNIANKRPAKSELFYEPGYRCPTLLGKQAGSHCRAKNSSFTKILSLTMVLQTTRHRKLYQFGSEVHNVITLQLRNCIISY